MELQEKIQNCYKISKNYPELVKALAGIGIESYTVDVTTGIILYRFAGGVTDLHAVKSNPVRMVSDFFSRDETIRTIRENQLGKSTYPEFMDGIARAGVRFYEATLSGPRKRVTYIGSGGSYEELIPV